MSDEAQRRRERAAGDDPLAEVAALAGRLRAGGDPAERVRLAAHLDHPAACLAYGRERDADASPWQVRARAALAEQLLSGAPPGPLPAPGAPPPQPCRSLLDPGAWSAFVGLFREISHDAAADEAAEALRTWNAARRTIRAAPSRLRGPTSAASQEELWTLYALGRVLDASVGPLAAADGEATPATVDWLVATLAEFQASVGLEPFVHPVLHPFFHEVVALEQDPDPESPPAITRVLWPGATFGRLLVLRSGVAVRAGRAWLAPAAPRTDLYFTYARRGRQAHDLSHGWGSNSQWRTAARRDYALTDGFRWNADGTEPLEEADPEGLPLDERHQLLAHRCFVRGAYAVARDPHIAPTEYSPWSWSWTLARGALPSGSRVAFEVGRASGWIGLDQRFSR